MPHPPKPPNLVARSETKAIRSERLDAERALMPRTQLTAATPAILHSHKKAARTWKRIIGLYNEIEGTIITAFDADLLIKYCLLEEEVDELALTRKKIKKEWESKIKEAHGVKLTNENLKDWVQMWSIVNALFARFQGMDARLDGKRKLLHTLSQSLYLTPRSRAGIAPPEKPPEAPKTDLEKMLS